MTSLFDFSDLMTRTRRRLQTQAHPVVRLRQPSWLGYLGRERPELSHLVRLPPRHGLIRLLFTSCECERKVNECN